MGWRFTTSDVDHDAPVNYEVTLQDVGTMTPEQQQEEISKAYLYAVAAQCGYAVGAWSQDHGGMDATIGAPSTVGAGHVAKPKVDVQLKATRRADVEHEEFVCWQLSGAHYDSLIVDASVPHLLVVLLLPENAGDTVEHTVNHLLIRRCAYWHTMTGLPPRAPDQASRTVRISKRRPFSPAALHAIMECISKGLVP